MEMGLDIAARTYTGIDSTRSIELPLTLTPLAIFLRTTVSGNAELCAYYRADQSWAYTMRVSTGGTEGRTRFDYSLPNSIMLMCSGGTSAQPASLECVILGVKK